MIDASVRRAHIGWNIRQNPVDIIIHTKQRVKVGGGFEEIESQRDPITVRIYQQTRQESASTVSERAGRKEVSDSYSMLADDAAALSSGPDLDQQFDAYPHGRFKIVSVHPQIVKQEICGYVVQLEKVK